jgi:hypothetical protein
VNVSGLSRRHCFEFRKRLRLFTRLERHCARIQWKRPNGFDHLAPLMGHGPAQGKPIRFLDSRIPGFLDSRIRDGLGQRVTREFLDSRIRGFLDSRIRDGLGQRVTREFLDSRIRGFLDSRIRDGLGQRVTREFLDSRIRGFGRPQWVAAFTRILFS